jgi:hypothetical protein
MTQALLLVSIHLHYIQAVLSFYRFKNGFRNFSKVEGQAWLKTMHMYQNTQKCLLYIKYC